MRSVVAVAKPGLHKFDHLLDREAVRDH